MRKLILFASGAAVGYVLGSRAGRQRYDEIVSNARKLWEHPTVQEAAGVVQAQATHLYDEGVKKVDQGVKKVSEKTSKTDKSLNGDYSTDASLNSGSITSGSKL
jgi:ABC-type branched-subunit amino acid transport system substrate-binding protein